MRGTAGLVMKVMMTAMLATALVACNGDNGGGGSVQAYCDLVEALNKAGETPSDDDLNDLKEAAPEEIAAAVETVADAVANADTPEEQAALGQDEDVLEASQELTEFDEKSCDKDEESSSTTSGESSTTSGETSTTTAG